MTLDELLTDAPDVYAVPGQNSIIDQIVPATGLTLYYGRTAADVAAAYPGAVRMTYAAWREAASARQRTPIVWTPCTEAQYTEMLEVLPPALWIGGAFLVGEATDHDIETGQPRFAAYNCVDHVYTHANRPLTRNEMRVCLGRQPKP